uniref:G-protein coupled receptors family 1 profile domain-containing protein n=1 Tax=Clastoptera arizonana TaxID=38151 RepID=A0A1B6D522_9HEMI
MTSFDNESDIAFPSSGSEFDRDEELAQAEIAILATILVVTIAGNTIVLVALYGRKFGGGRKKLSRMYYFILHLCIADLVTAVLNVFPQLVWDITYRFKGGPILCKLVKYGQTLGSYLSSYVLMSTAMDRYKAICHPLTYCSWTSRRSRAMIRCAWIMALVFCIPQVKIFSYQEIAPGIYDCWATFPQPWGEKLYVTWYSISVFIIPLCVLIYTYTCICLELWRNAGFPQSSSSPHRLISRAKINTIKQTVTVIALYIGCSSPFICAQLWASWDPDALSSPFLEGPTFTILSLLSSLNSCVNPWIYLTFNRELLRALRLVLTCSWSKAEYKASTHSGESGSSGCATSGCKRAVTESTTNAVNMQVLNQPVMTCYSSHPEVKRWVGSVPKSSCRDPSGIRTFRPSIKDTSLSTNTSHHRLLRYCEPSRAARCKPDL